MDTDLRRYDENFYVAPPSNRHIPHVLFVIATKARQSSNSFAKPGFRCQAPE